MEKKGKHMADITPDEQGLFVMPDLDDTADLSAAKVDAKMVTVPDYAMPDEVYRVLKWVGLIMMPALATLIGAIGPVWGMPKVDAIVLTINALGTFIGVCIGASQMSAMGKPDRSWE